MAKGGKKGEVPQCVKSNSLQGSTVNKIIQFGLDGHADELRQAGYSLSEITRQLNEKYLVDSEYKVSVMSLQRYFARHSSIDKVDNRIKDEEALNFCNEYRMLYDLTTNSIDAISQSIETFQKSNDYKGVRENSFLLEKLMARAQNLLQSQADMVDKVNNYINLVRITEIMFQIIEEQCGMETVAKIKNSIREHKELVELTRKIQETK